MNHKKIVISFLVFPVLFLTACTENFVVNDTVVKSDLPEKVKSYHPTSKFVEVEYAEIDKNDWETYRNDKYHYGIMYPKDSEIHFPPQSPQSEAPRGFGLYIDDKELLNITVWDPFFWAIEKEYSDKKDLLAINSLPVEEYVNYIWKFNKEDSENKPNKKISEIKKIDINGYDAYQFRLTQSYTSHEGGHLFDYKYFTYLSNGTYRYNIESVNSNLALNIVNTLKVVK